MVSVSVSKTFVIKKVSVSVSEKKWYKKNTVLSVLSVLSVMSVLSALSALSVLYCTWLTNDDDGGGVFSFCPLSIYFGPQVLNMAGKL